MQSESVWRGGGVGVTPPPHTHIYLGNTMGRLMMFVFEKEPSAPDTDFWSMATHLSFRNKQCPRGGWGVFILKML